jgi:hypothetical protein
LLKARKFQVHAITREGSKNKIPVGVHVKKVNYDNQSSLVEALKNIDALVITMAVGAPPDQQSKLIDAAASANVPWVIPNEFGCDGLHEQGGEDILLGPENKAFRDQVEKLGKSSWIGIACGLWYEFSLSGGPEMFGFDFKKQEVTFFDDGTTRVNASTWAQNGRSVAHLLALKVLPEDESDKSVCISHYRNNFVYVSSFTLSQRDMFESILRVKGESANDWTQTSVPVKEVYQQGVDELNSGNRVGFARLLYARTFYPDKYALYEETRGLDNDKLGLPSDEELDEFTKEAIHMAESDYHNSLS